MRKILCVVLIMLVLCGCNGEKSMDSVLGLRGKLQNGSSHFDAVITADYGDRVFHFTLSCSCDPEGNLQFNVVSPDTISDISGSITASGGKLEFDDTALAFPLLADGQLSPVSGPWVMMKALLGGYIQSAGADGEYLRATILDSYAEDAMTVDVWLNENLIPVQGEILWDGRRILTIKVENFEIA